MKNNIILIGFMGSGKTTIGKRLAQILEYQFIDTDAYIEQQMNLTVKEIFTMHSEEYFRRLETETIKELKNNTTNTIIATGGGLALREENALLLKQLGMVIFLQVGKDEVLNRLSSDTTRPLLQGENVEQKVAELLAYRNPKYSVAADYIICVDGRSKEQIISEVQKLLKKQL